MLLACVIRHTSLHLHLILAHGRCLLGEVNVNDTALGGRQVFVDVGQVVDGGFQTVLNRTDICTIVVNSRQSAIENLYRLLRLAALDTSIWSTVISRAFVFSSVQPSNVNSTSMLRHR